MDDPFVITIIAMGVLNTIGLTYALIEDLKGNNVWGQKSSLYYTNSEYMMAKTIAQRSK